MPRARLEAAKNLKAIINVAEQFPANIDYDYAMARGVRVLNVKPGVRRTRPEVALGMAPEYRHAESAGQIACSARARAAGWRQQCLRPVPAKCGFIGMGDLGRAILPLLAPFARRSPPTHGGRLPAHAGLPPGDTG